MSGRLHFLDFVTDRCRDCGRAASEITEADCVTAPFITGDWSVDYAPIAEQTVVTHHTISIRQPEHFPAAAMRDSAF